MDNIIIFNHIPRTGGTTLRVILNRVYGEEHVFFINSRDIPSSLAEYKRLSPDEQTQYKVISGHGALHFQPTERKVFTITILRDPVSLFLSQYHYLRRSENSNFLEEVSALASIEDYIEYAVSKGQDNMMVRCLDPENLQFTVPDTHIQRMEDAGEHMLQRAIKSLQDHDAILNLSTFDKDIYSLARTLAWKRIPVYRPLNTGNYPGHAPQANKALKERLEKLLRYDIELYSYFCEKIKRDHKNEEKRGVRYCAFVARQRLIHTFFSR